jgi:hypothetical protein
MKTFMLALLTCTAWASACSAAQPIAPPNDAPLIQVDWQDPSSLPRQFRNHCAYDRASNRYYCSDHCGAEYQFYYCKPKSFGCCRINFGYCDWKGLLRCAP